MPRPRNADPEIQKYYDEKARRESERDRRYELLQKPILDDLRKCGVETNDLFALNVKLPDSATEVLLAHLSRLSADSIPGLKGAHTWENVTLQDAVIRCLFLVKPGFDGRPLVEAFKNSWEESIRWIILLVIAKRKPTGIDDWIEELRKTPRGQTLKDLEPKRRRR